MFWVQIIETTSVVPRGLTRGHMRQFHIDDRNHCRSTSIETDTYCSVRYGRAVRRKHFKTRADSLYSVLWLISSQWSSSLIDVIIGSNFRFKTMIWAASLSTDCTIEHTATIVNTAYNKRMDQCCNYLNSQCTAYGSKLTEVVKATTPHPSYLHVKLKFAFNDDTKTSHLNWNVRSLMWIQFIVVEDVSQNYVAPK